MIIILYFILRLGIRFNQKRVESIPPTLLHIYLETYARFINPTTTKTAKAPITALMM
jgi:hypothetical protein